MTDGQVTGALKFGAHYADDGNTWIGDDLGQGVEFDPLPDGGIEVTTGSKWESYSYQLDREEAQKLTDWLSRVLKL